MGFNQTPTHKNGKGSYHQIGLVRGQFGNVPMDKWVPFLKDVGFDGWEEASWELDLRKCDTDAGAAAYAKERVALAQKHGLEIFTVATHLQGQALGDEPTAKTLQFIGPGEARAMYKAWRDKGNKPPRTNPYYVPDDVGRLLHKEAQRDLMASCAWPATWASCKTARWPCPASSARRPTAGATSSCSRRCRRAWKATPSPTCARSASSCWPSGSAPSSTCASSTASRSTWSATRASGRWATSSRPATTSTS